MRKPRTVIGVDPDGVAGAGRHSFSGGFEDAGGVSAEGNGRDAGTPNRTHHQASPTWLDAARRGARVAAPRARGPHLHRCQGSHGRERWDGARERPLVARRRTRARSCVGGELPGSRAPAGHARLARQLGLHLGPLACDRRRRRRPVPASPAELRPAAEHHLHLGRDRVPLLRPGAGRAASAARRRARRHRARTLDVLPRIAAALTDESVRGLPEPPLRLEPRRRDHPLPDLSEPPDPCLRGPDAGGDGARGRRDRQPLRRRHRRGRPHRSPRPHRCLTFRPYTERDG